MWLLASPQSAWHACSLASAAHLAPPPSRSAASHAIFSRRVRSPPWMLEGEQQALSAQELPSSQPSVSSLVPIVDAALIDRVQKDIWRTSEPDAAQLFVTEQKEAMGTVLKALTQLIANSDEEALSSLSLAELKARAAELGVSPPADRRLKKAWIEAIAKHGIASELPQELLNRVVAPHLPLLLLRGFPSLLREALSEVKTDSQLSAVRHLNDYMIGVVRQMEESLGDLQWKQQEKLRDLCSAALEGGTEQLLEMAHSMREELDTDFCNFLNFAIEQEQTRLRAVRARLGSIHGEADVTRAHRKAWSRLQHRRMAQHNTPSKPASKSHLPRAQGTYSLLSKDYDEDVKLIRLIIGLNSREARKELAARSLLEMRDDDRVSETRPAPPAALLSVISPAQTHFAATIERISSNLSVQRNAQARATAMI
ncbi:MAG: hypothetical protein SGPRY_013753 [Prymnesium sp.]